MLKAKQGHGEESITLPRLWGGVQWRRQRGGDIAAGSWGSIEGGGRGESPMCQGTASAKTWEYEARGQMWSRVAGSRGVYW